MHRTGKLVICVLLQLSLTSSAECRQCNDSLVGLDAQPCTATPKLYTVRALNDTPNHNESDPEFAYELQTESSSVHPNRFESLYSRLTQDQSKQEPTNSTSNPLMGFGKFMETDDEDYSGTSNNTEDDAESLDGARLASTPSLGWGHYDSAKNANQVTDNDDGFGDDDSSMFERTIIIGNDQDLPQEEISFLTKNDMITNFEGCFCDSYKQSTPISNVSTAPMIAAHNSTCRHNPRDWDRRTYCLCIGQSVISIPNNFSCGVHRIILWNVSLIKLESNALQIYPNLSEIYMNKMKHLQSIEAGAFAHLTRLTTIHIKLATQLKCIAGQALLAAMPKLMHLKVIHSALERLPHLHNSPRQIMAMIDLDFNQIRNLTSNSVRVKTENFNIEYNPIVSIAGYAFNGSQIGKLSFKGNDKLVFLDENAFAGLLDLHELDLSETSLTRLPTNGLHKLVVLRLLRSPALKEIPSIYRLKAIKEAHLTYAFHCCAFKYPAHHDPAGFARMKEQFRQNYCDKQTQPKTKGNIIEHSSVAPDSLMTSRTHSVRTIASLKSERYGNLAKLLASQPEVPGSDAIEPSRRAFIKEFFIYNQKKTKLTTNDNEKMIKLSASDGSLPTFTFKQNICQEFSMKMPEVKCFPEPDAFNPCEDVMGNDFIRSIACGVTGAALVGNSAVIIVLISGRFGFNVSKFLMINLAIADLMMGVYLLNIVMIDFKSREVYFNYASDWQLGTGCKVAGFLTVFATVLSIFTLTIITLERLFAITHAIHFDRRLKLNIAVKVMIFGWLYAIFMASLPLMGVNSYTKTSICLPMEHQTLNDKLYLIALLSINGIAFILITACYAKMYTSIISQKTRATINDMTIAKRMALLIFTDFACWAPIAFFGLTAIAGYPLIDVTKSKFLLVTFYPLNSCANPFLYAILTKQYRRDFFILVSRYGVCKDQAMRYKNGPARNHLNYYIKQHHHHHRHRRAEPIDHSSDLMVKANKRAQLNNPAGENGSCESGNVQLYKYSCPSNPADESSGQHHHHHHHGRHRHYCAVYHHFVESREHSTSFHPHRHLYHSCSDIERSNVRDAKPVTSQEFVELHSDSHVQSISEAEHCHHRRHKKCHDPRCQLMCRKSIACHHNSRHECCLPPKSEISKEACNEEAKGDNKSNGDVHNQAGSNELNRQVKNKIFCLSSDESKCSHPHECCREKHMTSRESSSVDQIHFLRNACKHEDECGFSNSVYYNRNNASSQLKQTACLNNKNKKSIISLLGRLSITKIVRKNESRSHKLDQHCCHSPDFMSQVSSSSTSSNHEHHLQCHHYRSHPRVCHNPHKNCGRKNHDQSNHNSDQEQNKEMVNSIPIEEERKMLQQALDENTTVQEAEAVVEELSSGARISSGSQKSH